MDKMEKPELHSFNYDQSSEVEHKELKRESYSVHYYVTGKPENTSIVFLHPAFADHRCFNKQIDYFSGNYRVITIDLPGHGLSMVKRSKDKIDQAVYHIAEILNKEGKDKAHFVGVSMGSLIAQYFSLDYPSMVLSLTVVGGYDINTDNREVAKAQRVENLKWIWKALVSMDSFRRYVANVSVYREEEKVRYYEMSQSFTRRSFSVMSGLQKITQLRKNIKRDYPLLLVCGEYDLEMVRKTAEKWHESEPDTEFHVIRNAGHCANMDKAPEFNEIVMGFIDKV